MWPQLRISLNLNDGRFKHHDIPMGALTGGLVRRTDNSAPNPNDRMLADVPLEEEVVLVRMDVAGEDVEPLLERGIVPGCKLCPVRHAPAGGPTVYRVDGALIALRKETASCLCVRSALEAAGVLDSN